MKANNKFSNLLVIFILCLGSLLVVIPFIWMIFSSFKEIKEFYYMPPKILPDRFTLANFDELFNRASFGKYYLNSILVTVTQVILNIIVVTTAGYGFSKFKFKGRKFLFTMVLATTMVPWVVTIIPLYILAYKAQVIDTYAGLIIPGMADAFSIFLARNFISTVPSSLLESARMDGAGEFAIFGRLVLPLIKPIIAVITITRFVECWNTFQWPLLVVTSEDKMTLPLAIAKFSGQYNDAYNLRMASAFLAIIPVIIVYITFQKYFVAGISLSGIKE